MVARSALKRFLSDERGATAIEVGLLVALLCIAIISAVSIVSGAIKTSFGKASTAMASTTGT